jgi:glutamate dehydrogenase
MNGNVFNPFEMAQAQFTRIADLLELEAGTRSFLANPSREYQFSLPVRMDDGQVKVFHGFRVQHNDARGPCKGGLRFHPEESIDTSRAQAMWSTWKCAVADIPLGGGSGGVICDPHNLSSREQEQICRKWVRQIAHDMGPHRDIPTPDMMVSPQHMLWMLDEYEVIIGAKMPGFITGKPVRLGGSQGRLEATGYGLVYALREALDELDLRIDQTRASIQGFGKVGKHVVQLFQRMGGMVIAISCWDQADQTTYTFRNKDGIDFDAISRITDRFGGINKNKATNLGYEILPGEQWISQDVEILIPAAIENQITADNVDDISNSVKIIAEGADGPTTPEADSIIAKKGIILLPDLLANSGGVICSYFEQVQSNNNFYWQLDEVLGKLDVKMTSAYIDVSDLAAGKKLNMRDAAYIIAVGRVAQACRDRNWV